MSVKLPILFYREDDNHLVDLGIKNEDEIGSEERIMIFYNIEALSPFLNDDIWMTCIHCSGQIFICPMHISEVFKRFEKP